MEVYLRDVVLRGMSKSGRVIASSRTLTQYHEFPTSLMPIQKANRLSELFQCAAAGLGAMNRLNRPTWSTMDLNNAGFNSCGTRTQVSDALDIRSPWSNEFRVNRCPTISKVEDLGVCHVILTAEELHPVGAIRGCLTDCRNLISRLSASVKFMALTHPGVGESTPAETLYPVLVYESPNTKRYLVDDQLSLAYETVAEPNARVASISPRKTAIVDQLGFAKTRQSLVLNSPEAPSAWLL